jgi:hypothetical protein
MLLLLLLKDSLTAKLFSMSQLLSNLKDIVSQLETSSKKPSSSRSSDPEKDVLEERSTAEAMQLKFVEISRITVLTQKNFLSKQNSLPKQVFQLHGR